ncbi:MAG: divalent-cation tolerance protein CutA [Alphaproteobacteria bacterium]|nr:divalent-cation tolerance protein CutA [Alphaproteobacteria bacterium]
MRESAVIIKTSTNDHSLALKLTTELLEYKKAACVQIQTVDSYYFWQDNKLRCTKEYVLNIKSLKSKASEIIGFIRARHNYALPEIIQINIDDCTSEYLSWMIKETKIQIAN